MIIDCTQKNHFVVMAKECEMKDSDIELLVEIKKLNDQELNIAIDFFNGVLEELSKSKSLEKRQNLTNAIPAA
jgi:hypothetical protein